MSQVYSSDIIGLFNPDGLKIPDTNL